MNPVTKISITIQEIRHHAIRDPDDPNYLRSGDPDDMEVIGFVDFYRVYLQDELNKTRLTLDGPTRDSCDDPLPSENWATLCHGIAEHLIAFLKEHQPAPNQILDNSR